MQSRAVPGLVQCAHMATVPRRGVTPERRPRTWQFLPLKVKIELLYFTQFQFLPSLLNFKMN